MNSQTTVLVIHQSEAIRANLHTMLEFAGRRVILAADARQGLEVLKQDTPDVTLIDLHMTDSDGLDVIAGLYKLNDTPSIIVMSGQGLRDDAVKASQYGACGYLTIPVNEGALEFAIGRCLERVRLLRSNRYYREYLAQLAQELGKEIQKSRGRFPGLLETAANYVYTVKVKDGKPVEIIHGPGCERLTGYTLDEFKADARLWFQIVYKDDRPQVFGLAQHMLNKPDIYTQEYRILHKDGSIRWVTSTLVPCQTPSFAGNYVPSAALVSYDAVISDITRRKAAGFEAQELMPFDTDVILASSRQL